MSTPQGAATFLNAISNAAGVGLESRRQKFAIEQAGQIQALNQANQDLNVKRFKHQQSRDRSVDPVTLSLLQAQRRKEDAFADAEARQTEANYNNSLANIAKQKADQKEDMANYWDSVRDEQLLLFDSGEFKVSDVRGEVDFWLAQAQIPDLDPALRRLALVRARTTHTEAKAALMSKVGSKTEELSQSRGEEKINLQKEIDQQRKVLEELKALVGVDTKIKEAEAETESTLDFINRVTAPTKDVGGFIGPPVPPKVGPPEPPGNQIKRVFGTTDPLKSLRRIR